MERIVLIGNIRVWFFIEPLRMYEAGTQNIIETNTYMCYFKFAEPTPFNMGQLLRNENNLPIVFNTIEEAIAFGTAYIKRIWNL